MKKLSILMAGGCVAFASNAAQMQPLLNQAHLWNEVEQALVVAAADTQKERFAIHHKLLKRTGAQGEYEHYQTFVGQWPVLESRFVMHKDSAGSIQQAFGRALVSTQESTFLPPKRFLQSNASLLNDIAARLDIATDKAELSRAYHVSNGQLFAVLAMKVADGKQVYRYLLDARSLAVISREQDLDKYNDASTLVAGGGIGGNEKLGAICYSPAPSSMNNCLNYQFDAMSPKGKELQFQVQNAAIFSSFSGYPFVVSKEGETCTFENPYVQTIDYLTDKSVAASYTCGENNEHFNKQAIDDQYYDYYSYQAVNEAHFNAGVVMQFYHSLLSEMYPAQGTSCSTSGYCLKQLKQNVGNNTFGSTQANWDDTHVNYGTGNYGGTHYFHTTLDVVAHEASHAVTYWNSGLGSSGQDGAINEAFSDIASVAVLDYLQKHTSGAYTQSTQFAQQTKDMQDSYQQNRKWWYGWDVMYEDKGARFFEMPSWDGGSIDHFKDYQAGLSIYHTGGVLRKAFYELVKTQGWTIEQAFKLFLRANVECFFPGNSIADAGQCLLSQARNFTEYGSEALLKSQLDQTLHSVGIIASNSQLSSLDVDSSINYDTVRYRLTSIPSSQIDKLEVQWGDGNQEVWQSSTGVDIYPFLERERKVNESELIRFKLAVTKKDGQQKVGYRHYYSRAVGAACEPYFNQGRVHTNSLTINSSQFALDGARYQSILSESLALNRHNEHVLTVPASLSDQRATVLVDSNRDGLFTAAERVLDGQLIGSNGTVRFKLPDSITAGVSMLRVAIGSEYNFYDTCGHTKLAQVVDIKTQIDVPELPISAGFDYQILANNAVKFTNTSVVNELRQPKYEWDFGFGETSTLKNPGTISYPQTAGDYTIELKVSYQDGSNESNVVRKSISLTKPQQCVVGISNPDNADALYIDEIKMWTSILDRKTVSGASGTNSSGYSELNTGFEFLRRQELTVDIVTNELSESTAKRLIENRETELRFTIWLDEDRDDKFEAGEENFSDMNSNYTKHCVAGRCTITASQSLFLPDVWWLPKDYVIRARIEELPQARKGQDGCHNFHYGEVNDLKFSVTR